MALAQTTGETTADNASIQRYALLISGGTGDSINITVTHGAG